MLTISVELRRSEALALAQFLKRMSLDDYRGKCARHDQAEADLMQAAGERVRIALAAEGVDPR